ncbi:MAG: CHASE domain-containing protein [Balneolaceae bacterium]|nr:CHASE domain-containing protein [Balneolaceae bacterium]
MKKIKIRSWTIQQKLPVLVFLLSLFITQYIAYLIYQAQKEKEVLQVEQEVIGLKNQLEESLNHSVTATKMLAYLIRNDLLGNHFDEIARELLELNDFIDAIQYVQGNTIISTYPLEGHEPTIGYAVLENSTHRREAMLALERGDLYFEGPFDLIQGGRGVVGRYPIVIDDEYWGFSAVVIRYETIINALGTDSSGSNETYTYQISKVSDIDLPIVFFEERNLFNRGVYATAFVPLGNWEIQVLLNAPVHLQTGLLFSATGLILSLILGLFLWYMANVPRRLQKLVDQKTSELESSNRKLEEYSKQLLQSNNELEQFAYVTSHDLQEPLRMITSFLSLLEKKYGDLLDDKGKQYIYYATDGARRMKQVILDLFEYSRIDSASEELKLVNMQEVLENTLALNRKLIQEKGAEIITGSLPEVYAAKSPMHQLFRNLIQNALIYHAESVKPKIKIGAEESESHWIFYVKDNGIGIPSEYHEKIFDIFQRLHRNEEYSGTGIGLAACKKIVEEHGGRIWVESEEGKGSAFYFTILKSD